jgi:hypothetical protein
MIEPSSSASTESVRPQCSCGPCIVDPIYDQFVEQLAKDHVAQVFTNQSAAHALSILRNAFKYAKHDVNIFSGTLDSCVYNDKELISEAKDFITRRNGIIRVLLQNAVDDSRTKDENDFLNAILSSGGHIKLTEDGHPLKNAEKHFFVSDTKAYRVELDIRERSAVCNFNDETLGGQLNKLFTSSWDVKTTPLAI